MSSGPLHQELVKLFAGVFVIFLAVSTSPSQQNPGSIKGTVTDPLGALVANALVVVRDANGKEISVNTDATGEYRLRNLRPGKYELLVNAPGFKIFEERSVVVAAGSTTEVNVELSVGVAEESVTVDERGISTDADGNADALVLRGRDLEALPTDPTALAAALQAMAGPPGDGQSGAQVTVDGFSGGQIPPREAIREVRINQNPFSAEYEFPGFGGIQIFTQPGSEKWRGGANFSFNDESLNSRSPFSPRRAPYQQRTYGGNVAGPIIPKRASFYFHFGRYSTDANAIVNATILDPATLRPVLFNQSFVTPQHSGYATFRSDLKLNKKHTLVGNYTHHHNSQPLQGFGGFALPTRAFAGKRRYQTVQFTETAMINERTINETRLQLIHDVFRQTSNAVEPALNVQGSFFGGGAQIGSGATSQQGRAELQNFTSWSSGNHFIKVGGRIRHLRIRSISPANFGGTYTFAGGHGPRLDANEQVVLVNGQPELIELNSLERYRRTLLFARQGLSSTQIRTLGGGATQFSIAAGNPAVSVKQTDVALFVQDEWKMRPNFTVSPGLRYENQTNINSHLNFAPRISFAWSPAFGIFGETKKASPVASSKSDTEGKPAPAPPATGSTAPAMTATAPQRQSKTVIRGGIGIFYNRVSEDLILQTLRIQRSKPTTVHRLRSGGA